MRAVYNTVVTVATGLSVYGVLVWAPWPSSSMLGMLVVAMGWLSWSRKPHPRRVHRLLDMWRKEDGPKPIEFQASMDHREPPLYVVHDTPGGLGSDREVAS